MLSVIYGPFNDLEPAFVERLRKLRSLGPDPIAVVAPSRRMADRLQRVACVEAGLALLDVHFHTFHSLAAALAQEAGGLPGRLVSDPVFLDAVVDGLIARSGSAFGGSDRPRALASAVRASLRDLVDAGVSTEHLAEHFGSELAPQSRLSALLALLNAYERRLCELGVVSASGLTRLATQLAEGSPRLGGFRAALYYGFYDLTGLQLDFFEAVCSRLPATLFFPYRRAHAAFRFADDFFEQKLAARKPQPAPRAAARPAVEPALDRLFSGEAGAPLADGALELLSASGSRDEVWAAAKEILALVEGGFCRLDEIGVLARSLQPYRAELQEVFAENAIPLDMAAGEPLLRRPAAKLAWTLLTLKRRDFPAVAALDILGSPYCARAPSARTLSLWRLAIQRLAIHAGWLQWRKLESRLSTGLDLDAGEPEPGERSERRRVVAPQDLRALWEALSSWQRRLSAAAGTWADLAAVARELVESELALPRGASQLERSSLELVLAQIDSLADFDLLGQAPSWDGFLDALERKLRAAALESGARGRGVRAMGAMDARGEGFAVVFLLGLKEKGFPRQIWEDPILRDPARAALRHPAGYWIGPKSAGYEEERLLFYLCCAAARRRLYCVYPRSDENGKAEVPSLYLRELCRASGLDLGSAKRVPRLPFERLESVALPLLCPRETSLRLSWSGEGASEYGRGVGLPGEALGACRLRLPRLLRAGEPGELDGIIAPPKSYMAAVAKRGISPSALDQLATCPFQFFAQRLLGLGGAQEPSEQGEISPWLRGRVYHAVLQRFYARLPGQAYAGGDFAPALSSALDGVFAEYGWRELGVYPLLWRAVREQMGARLRDFIAWDLAELRASGLRPLWLERELSGSLPGGLRVFGVVDRVDAGGGRARVVDYKTSWKKSLGRLVREGLHHQLPIYARLVASELGLEGALQAAILAIEDSPELSGRQRSQALAACELASGAEAFLRGLARRVSAMGRGRFPIAPDEGEWGHCAWCDFKAICRKAHAPTRARSARA